MRIYAALIFMIGVPILVITLRPVQKPDTRLLGPEPEIRAIAEPEPLTEDEFDKLQQAIRLHEANRPRHQVDASQADVDKTLQTWGRTLFEADMGSSVRDGGPIPVHDKIHILLYEPDRRRDLEDQVRALTKRIEKLEGR